ncbi:MAG: hypothetical protein WAT67_05775 [Candidatus Contendobacter sp.]
MGWYDNDGKFEAAIFCVDTQWKKDRKISLVLFVLASDVDIRRLYNYLLSRTLRARDNGAADTIRCLRGATRRTTTRIKPTSGGKAYGFTDSRGLSAAPLGVSKTKP